MRAVGEKGISSLAQTKKSLQAFKRKDVDVKCKECGMEASLAVYQIRGKKKEDWVCWDCQKKGKDEAMAACAALENRRAAIKAAKRKR